MDVVFKKSAGQWTLVPFRISDWQRGNANLGKQFFHIPKICSFYSSTPKLSIKPKGVNREVKEDKFYSK